MPASEPREAADFGALVDVFDGDRSAVTELLGMALATIEEVLARMTGPGAAPNSRSTAEDAHRVKGTAGTIGCTNVVGISSSIEDAARHGSAISEHLLDDFRAAVTALRDDIAFFVHFDASRAVASTPERSTAIA